MDRCSAAALAEAAWIKASHAEMQGVAEIARDFLGCPRMRSVAVRAEVLPAPVLRECARQAGRPIDA